MSSIKDPRRADLIIPYARAKKDKDAPADMSSTAASTLPMAAMFTRNKYIGWTSVVFALQNWLSEGPNSNNSTPAIMSLGMSFMAVAVTYLPLFMPAQPRAPVAPVPVQ